MIGHNQAGSVDGLAAKLLCPTRGILRGIFGDEMPAGKGGPDKDSKLLKITVGELREYHRCISALQSRVEVLEGALDRLRKAALILQANCIGCAQNHHGHNFAEQGMPGWLADTAEAINDAAALKADEPVKGEGRG